MKSLLRIALEDNRPLRKAVRVIIRKGNKIILGRRIKDSTGELLSYDFIGGGVDEGETMVEAVIKECLEEVGIKVGNIVELGVVDAQYFTLPNPERAKIYAGGEDNYFLADYEKKDTRLFNTEGDAMPHEYVTVDQAIRMIQHGPFSPYNAARLKALQLVKHM